MKTARLVKFQKEAERPAAPPQPGLGQPQKIVRDWLSEYQQQKLTSPREQFAQLFKLAA